jgi:transcriptional regulator with XRE-family HTH domain
MTVKDRIRAIRQFKNISTYALGEATEMGQSVISRMENGKRNINVEDAVIIAKALDVPVEAFFYDNKMLEAMQR